MISSPRSPFCFDCKKEAVAGWRDDTNSVVPVESATPLGASTKIAVSHHGRLASF